MRDRRGLSILLIANFCFSTRFHLSNDMISKDQLLDNGRLSDSLSSDHHEPIELSNMMGHRRAEPKIPLLSSTLITTWLVSLEMKWRRNWGLFTKY